MLVTLRFLIENICMSSHIHTFVAIHINLKLILIFKGIFEMISNDIFVRFIFECFIRIVFDDNVSHEIREQCFIKNRKFYHKILKNFQT